MATATARLSPFAVFANRRFRALWIAQLVSTIGDSLVDIAAAILVYRVTGSALAVGLVLMATAAPALLVGLFAGVAVDRYDRKRIMVVCDLLRGAIVLAIPFLISLGVWWLYLAVALVSAVGTFFQPAHSSVLPEIASDEELAAATVALGVATAVLPGLGQPAAEWRRAVALLRGAAAAPGLRHTRAAAPEDFAALAARLPAMGALTPAELRELASSTLVAEAPAGHVIVRTGDASDAGYFIVSGRARAMAATRPSRLRGKPVRWSRKPASPRPLRWFRSWRTVILPATSGSATVNPGRYRRTGASRSSRPCWASWSTASPVNDLLREATRKRVRGVTDAPSPVRP